MNLRLVITDGTTTGLYAQFPLKSLSHAVRVARRLARDYYRIRKTKLSVSIISVSAPIETLRLGNYDGNKIVWSYKK